jgi:hypothetical protein
MSVRDERRSLGRIVPALAGCLGVLLAPVVVGLGFVAWALTSIDGCEVGVDVGPAPAGVTGRPGGPITARLPGCENHRFSVVRLLADDGSTVWSAEAPQPTDVERLTVGRAPPGFRDTVPVPARPLDARATYDLELLVIRPTGDTAARVPRGSPESDLALAFGATARFRPADLRPDRVWVDGRLVAVDRFERTACADANRRRGQ